MSEPLKVRIARAGKELGSFEVGVAVKLLSSGQLEPTDHFWLPGMAGWELLSKLKETVEQRSKSEAEERSNRERAEREMRLRDEERLRRKVEEAVKQRLSEERSKGQPSKGGDGGTLGCVGGVLFVGGVLAVLNAFSSRDKEQSIHNGIYGYIPGTRTYEKIDSSGYEAVAFVAGAIALLGIGLIVAWLSRRK
jgi:hypothetical protein